MQLTIKHRACALLLLVATLLGVFLFLPLQVSANSIRDSSDVLADLKQDPSFNTDEYPVINGDTAINFIHLVESEQGEVLIYVYQPHQDYAKYRASSINISATADGSLDIKNYYLDLVDYDGVFQKYVVRDLPALAKGECVYEVVSIFRMFDAAVDKGLSDDNDNTIQEVVYPVGKKFEFRNTPNGLTTNVSDLEYIKVTDKYVGFMRYPAGLDVGSVNEVDVHYVAFSTQYAMDELLEADVFYIQQSYMRTGVLQHEGYGDKEKQYSYLKSDVDMEFTGSGWNSQKYSWNTIENSSAFLESCSDKTLYSQGVFNTTYAVSTVNEDAKKEIAKCDWVLRFAVTDYTTYVFTSQSLEWLHTEATIVGEVTILRLAFETDGQYYNLPVIDNKQSGSLTPSNKIEYQVQASEWWQKIMMLLCIVLLVVLLIAFAGPVGVVLKILASGFTFLFKLFLWVILLPFKLLGALFKRGRRKR